MEKKKLLLVAVSVGAVLMIIITIPLFFVSPRQNARSTQPITQEFFPPQEIIPLFNNEQPAIIEPPVLTQIIEEPVRPPVTQAEPSRVTTITVPAPQTAAVPRASDVQTRPAPARTAQPRQTAAPARETRPEAAASRPAARPASAETRTAYWVQTGAFSTKVRAENAKESLENKGIKSIIENRDIDGRTWYRVRVGPYTTENEANYWLALVKAIDGFGESQVRQTTVLR